MPVLPVGIIGFVDAGGSSFGAAAAVGGAYLPAPAVKVTVAKITIESMSITCNYFNIYTCAGGYDLASTA